MLRYLRARLSERSTWIGMGSAAGAAVAATGQYLSHHEVHDLALFAAICGIIAMLVPTGGQASYGEPE